MEQKKYSGKEFTMNVLNALALGVVVTLIPGALLGELVKALLPVFPQGQLIIQATQVANTLMGAIIGLMVGQFFKFTPIQTGALALAVLFAGGVANFNPEVKGIIFSGTGDIITMGLTAALGAAVILWIGNKAKAYSIIVIPTVLLVVVGGVGRLALPYIKTLTTLLGQGIGTLLTLQPVIMCFLLAVIFRGSKPWNLCGWVRSCDCGMESESKRNGDCTFHRFAKNVHGECFSKTKNLITNDVYICRTWCVSSFI